MESISHSDGDTPPPPPEGVHTQEKELPSYSKMMASLVDQVKAKVNEEKSENIFEAYVAEIKSHITKIEDLQKQLQEQLMQLDKEERRYITSENIHTGFNSSHVTKADHKVSTPAEPPRKRKTTTEKAKAVEVLNPHALASRDPLDRKDSPQSSGADADVDEPDTVDDDDNDADVEASELGKQFAQIKMRDYRASLQFISANPQVMAEKETDGLLVLAFNACMDGKEDYARQCVHQALLLQYCRALGRDGVHMFFKRITTQGHQAQKVFYDDVNSTYQRIRTRTKEIEKQRAQEEADGSGGVEQIQLHAVDPGTTINISIPPPSSQAPDEVKARELFNAFPPGLQRALESGSLDEVNKVLGKMSVEQAEEIVAQLGEVSLTVADWSVID